MKKKATIIVLTAMLIVSFYHEIYSQPHFRFVQHRNLVMATNGLNLRTTPSTTGEKIINIPYGEKVQIMHKDHYGLDTIYTIKSQLRDHPVYGFWQKVKYGKHEGYVHNAFLSFSKKHINELSKDKNNDYIYLRPGYDCGEEFYNSSEYFWYGYYQQTTDTGEPLQKPYRKLIDVEFINTADEMMGSGTIVKEDRHLQFIIGTKKALPESKMGSILNKRLYHRIDQYDEKPDSLVMAEGKIMMCRDYDDENPEGILKFFLTSDNNEQLINIKQGSYFYNLAEQYIQADLDGDGKDDYIFEYIGKSFNIGLFLSSEAEGDEITKQVSFYQRGPCC